MHDPTEAVRRTLVHAINFNPGPRQELEAEFGVGNVFDTDELTEHFNVEGFAAPYVVVREKSTGKRGTLTFQHSPRFYFDFQEVK